MSTSPWQPATTEELAELLQQNAQGEKFAVLPKGGGAWLDFGNPVAHDLELQTTGLDKVRDYPARDMTITVEAGLPVGKLLEVLQAERQQIPVDFSQAQDATIGGVIAANISGPRRFGLGTLRDYLIGLAAVDAGGRVFHAGGRVVKNVAGYDLCKLMVGSWGTLAVLTEVTLKVLPIPETQAWLWSTWTSASQLDAALAGLLTSETRPLAIEVLNASAVGRIVSMMNQDWPQADFVLAVLVAGSADDTDWQTLKLKEELASHHPKDSHIIPHHLAGDLLEALTNYPLTVSPLTVRAHLLPSNTMEFTTRATDAGFSVQSHAGNGVITAHAPPEFQTPLEAAVPLVPLRTWTESKGGSLVILNCPADWKASLDVFGQVPSAWPLMQDLKKTLDPLNLLSRGRFWA